MNRNSTILPFTYAVLCALAVQGATHDSSGHELGNVRVGRILQRLSEDCRDMLIRRHRLLDRDSPDEIMAHMQLSSLGNPGFRDVLLTHYVRKEFPQVIKRLYGRWVAGDGVAHKWFNLVPVVQSFFSECAMVEGVTLPDGFVSFDPEHTAVNLHAYEQLDLIYLFELIARAPHLIDGPDIAQINVEHLYHAYKRAGQAGAAQDHDRSRQVLDLLADKLLAYHHAGISDEIMGRCTLNGEPLLERPGHRSPAVQWYGDRIPVIGSSLIDALAHRQPTCVGFQFCRYMPDTITQVVRTIQSLELNNCSPLVVDQVIAACALQAAQPGFALQRLSIRDTRKRAERTTAMKTLSDRLYHIPMLTALNLTGLGLVRLSADIKKLSQITWLNLANNSLTQLPQEIGSLAKLRSLYVGGNDLTALPSSIGNLKELRVLNVLHNKELTRLPITLRNCYNLRSLESRNADDSCTFTQWPEPLNVPHVLAALWRGSRAIVKRQHDYIL